MRPGVLGWGGEASAGRGTRGEAEPWVMITEASEKAPQEAKGTGVLVAKPGTKEVASQAPCTYTVVRGHARGRFLPLPESAHG